MSCLGQWMNHLPPYWWSIFGFVFLKHLVCQFGIVEIVLLISCIYSCVIHYCYFAYYLSFHITFYTNNFVLSYSMDRHNIYFMLLCIDSFLILQRNNKLSSTPLPTWRSRKISMSMRQQEIGNNFCNAASHCVAHDSEKNSDTGWTRSQSSR